MKPRWMTNHAKDISEPKIREALEEAGFEVWDHLPCDLLAFRPDKGVKLIECKTPDDKGRRRKRYDQKTQEEFLARTGTPVALTPEEALRAVGAI